MFYKKNGEWVGLLSGGCVEEDLFYRISELGEQLMLVLILYDMWVEDDFFWGMGVGCNGIIYIYVE